MDRDRDPGFEAAVGDACAALTDTLFSSAHSLADMARAVLEQALALTESRDGRVTVLDPASGEDVTEACTPAGDEIPEDAEWPRSLTVSAVAEGRLVGRVVLAGAPDGYGDRHVRGVGRLARLFAVAVDHRRTVQALIASERLHGEAQRIARIGHWALDLRTDHLSWSDQVFRIFELEPAQFSASYEAFLGAIHPDDREKVDDAYRASVESRTPYSIRHRLLIAGERVKHVHEHGETFYAEDGTPLRSVGTVQDVTALVEAEEAREKVEARLRQSQKMEAIGTLAGGIAHDFNNMLTPIVGFGQVVLESLPEGSAERQHQEQVVKAAMRAGELVKQILTFSRQTEEERRPVQLQLIVKEALRLLRASIPTTVEMRIDIDPSCGYVLAEPTHIHQVVLNLCTNAWQAMRDTGGVLAVSLREVDIAPDDGITRAGHAPGRYVRLTVSDTGHGMPADVREKIFEPYFTTKPKGEGTGLGLSIVHGIVHAHEGFLSVYSEPGEGTTFHASFPVVRTAESEGEAPTAAEPGAEFRGVRVLVVDDEAPIAEMLWAMLGAMGHEVTATTSSPEALALFRSDPAAFDVIITDMTMPRLTGLDLARHVLEQRPELPIVLCTGFSELVTEESARAAGIRAFMMKPVLRSELIATLREICCLPRSGRE